MGKASHRKNKSIILLGASLITFGCVLAVTSLAWFCPPQSNANVTGMTGKATGSYFESGDGSSTAPYVIANAKQLYYFNWLQDLGYFNKDNDNDGTIDTVYFKIKDGLTEINAENYVLPPAGTSSNPFVGNFDGNGCVIKNLTISNSWEDLQSTKPAAAKQNGNILQSAEIVGFFGIVGEYETDIAYSTSTNAIKDLYFDNLTVESASSSVLAGFIAGYANGAIDNCGIHCGQFSFVNGATPLTGTKLKGESISRFTLIGDYDETSKNFVWNGRPTSGGSDEGNDWGGSIDIYDFSKRLTYIMNKNQTYSSFAVTGVNEAMGLKGIKFTRKTGKVLYEMVDNSINIYNGSYFPINVDTEEEFKNETRGTITSNSKTLAYAITDYFSNASNTSEKILNSNTGYITSTTSENQIYHYIWKNQKVGASLGFTGTRSGSNTTYPSGAYVEDNLVMLNLNSDGTLSRIVDGNNTVNNTNLNSYTSTINASELSQYSKVKKNIAHFLTNSNNYIYALAWNVSGTPSTITGTFKLNGTEYAAAYAPGMDFYVSNKGYITAVFCSNANGNGNKLFSLYKVTRSGSTVSISKVENVIPTTTSTFCSAAALLYLQIPVDPGEYYIGPDADGTGSASAGFMYLDIGANAGESSDTGGEIETTNIDFVYKESGVLAKITDEGYTPSGVVFSIGGPSTSAGLIYFKRESKENKDGETVVVGVAYYTATGCSITPSGNGKSTNKEPDPDQ